MLTTCDVLVIDPPASSGDWTWSEAMRRYKTELAMAWLLSRPTPC